MQVVEKEKKRESGWLGPTQWSLAASNALFCLNTNTTSVSVDIVWRRKIHGNKANLWLETSWIWNWCCRLRADQTPEWRKVGREMQRLDICLSPQFPIFISTNGRRLKKKLPGLETGRGNSGTLGPSHLFPASTHYDSEADCLIILLAVSKMISHSLCSAGTGYDELQYIWPAQQ